MRYPREQELKHKLSVVFRAWSRKTKTSSCESFNFAPWKWSQSFAS